MSVTTSPLVPTPEHPGTHARADDSEGDAQEYALTFFALAVGISALALLPTIGWLADMDGYHAALSVIYALMCSIGATCAIYRHLRPCLLIASTFPYCWLALPQIYQISHVQAAWQDPGATSDFSATIRAQLILVLAQGALFVGYALTNTLGRKSSAPAWKIQPQAGPRLLWIGAGLALLATLLVPVVISAAGGLSGLYQSRDAFNVGLASSGNTDAISRGLLKIAPSSFAASSAILSLWVMRTAPAQTGTLRWAKILATYAAVLLLIVANPFAYTRYIVLASFGSVAMAYFRPRGRLAGLLLLAICIGAFLLAYPTADLFRAASAQKMAPLSLLASRDFDGFQQTINSVHYVDHVGLQWGLHLISGLLFFVPRALWTGKAEPGSIAVAQDRGYSFADLSLPLPAEAYVELSWAGVVVVFLLVGFFWSRLDLAWRSQSKLAVLAAYLSVAQVGMWRGPFGSLAPIFGLTIGLLVTGILLSAGPNAGPSRFAKSHTRLAPTPGAPQRPGDSEVPPSRIEPTT